MFDEASHGKDYEEFRNNPDYDYLKGSETFNDTQILFNEIKYNGRTRSPKTDLLTYVSFLAAAMMNQGCEEGDMVGGARLKGNVFQGKSMLCNELLDNRVVKCWMKRAHDELEKYNFNILRFSREQIRLYFMSYEEYEEYELIRERRRNKALKEQRKKYQTGGRESQKERYEKIKKVMSEGKKNRNRERVEYLRKKVEEYGCLCPKCGREFKLTDKMRNWCYVYDKHKEEISIPSNTIYGGVVCRYCKKELGEQKQHAKISNINSIVSFTDSKLLREEDFIELLRNVTRLLNRKNEVTVKGKKEPGGELYCFSCKSFKGGKFFKSGCEYYCLNCLIDFIMSVDQMYKNREFNGLDDFTVEKYLELFGERCDEILKNKRSSH